MNRNLDLEHDSYEMKTDVGTRKTTCPNLSSTVLLSKTQFSISDVSGLVLSPGIPRKGKIGPLPLNLQQWEVSAKRQTRGHQDSSG